MNLKKVVRPTVFIKNVNHYKKVSNNLYDLASEEKIKTLEKQIANTKNPARKYELEKQISTLLGKTTKTKTKRNSGKPNRPTTSQIYMRESELEGKDIQRLAKANRTRAIAREMQEIA